MTLINTIVDHYQWRESLFTLLGCITLTILGKRLLVLIPPLKTASAANREIARQRMGRNYCSVVQRRASLAGLFRACS